MWDSIDAWDCGKIVEDGFASSVLCALLGSVATVAGTGFGEGDISIFRLLHRQQNSPYICLFDMLGCLFLEMKH